MTEIPKIAAYTGGELHILPSESKTKDVVLALPISRLLVKFVHVPAGSEETPEQIAVPILKELSPFPDEELTVSCETMHESEDGSKVVMAAAFPESAAGDIGEKLDEAKLNVVRIDALPLGMMRALLPRLGGALGADVRTLFLEKTADGVNLLVFDGGEPVSMRSFGEGAAIRYEVMLGLMDAENFAGPRPLGSIVAAGMDAKELSDLAPVTEVEGVPVDEALQGIAERTAEPGALNVLPASWLEVLNETRFKAKLVRRLVAAGVVWLLAMGVLFGVPAVYGMMTDHQKTLIKEHHRRYQEVEEIRNKVETIRKYSNHVGGALDTMRVISELLPDAGDGFTLTSWDFQRNEIVKLSGKSVDEPMIIRFKEALANCGAFSKVDLQITSSRSKKDGDQQLGFTIDLIPANENEEDAQ